MISWLITALLTLAGIFFLLGIVVPIMINNYNKKPDATRQWTDPKQPGGKSGLRSPDDR